MPRDLASECPDHPHDENGETGVPILTPVPAAAAETTPAPAQLEPATVRVAGVRANPEAVERILARRLEMREGEAGDIVHVAKRDLIPCGKPDVGLERGDLRHLLGRVLVNTACERDRNPRDKTMLGRRIGKVPVLKMLEFLPCRPHLRNVPLEETAGLHLGMDPHGVGDAQHPRLLPDVHDLTRFGLRLLRVLHGPSDRLVIGEKSVVLSGHLDEESLEARLEILGRKNALRAGLAWVERGERVAHQLLGLFLLPGRDLCGHRLSPWCGGLPLPEQYAGLGFTTCWLKHTKK